MEIVDLDVLSNSNEESFQKQSWQHVRIVPKADMFVRFCPTNKSAYIN